MQKRIFVVGSSNTDMVVKSAKLPAPGETVIGSVFLMNPGGKGANQAVAAARLGGEVTFVSKIGKDVFGEQTLRGLAREGMDTRFVFTDAKQPSGVALILVDERGENSIAVAPGSNATLGSAEVDLALESLQADDWVVVQLEIPILTVEHTVRKAFLVGAKVILNPAPAQTLNEAIFPCLHLITPNETEAELLTGIKVVDAATAAKAARFFLDKGIANAIITLGAQGAWIANAAMGKLVAAPAVQATDTTAAGDVFNGALAVALSQGHDLESAAAFACRAAAISVTRMGAQASAPYRRELPVD